MLKTRILSAAVFIPLTVVLLILGGWIYAIAIGVILTISGVEFSLAMRQGGHRLFERTLIAAIVLIVVAQSAGIAPQVIGPGLAIFLIVAVMSMIAAYSSGDPTPTVNFGLTVAGALYIGWLGAHLVAIRQLPGGLYWALISIMGTGFADVGAYFFGRLFGRRRMAPIVSPSKTWEGYLGGVITAAVVSALIAALFAPLPEAQAANLQALDGALIGLLVGFLSPLGDLGMSTFKRKAGVKNFSNILPGHGGMLDRLDSILVGVTVSYYLILWFVG